MKNYLVAGLGKSGISAAELLASQGGAEVFAWDEKPRKSFDQSVLESLEGKGVHLLFGTPVDRFFDELILSPGISPSLEWIEEQKKKGAVISGELQLAFERCPGCYLAVTGTNGKTTTTALLGELMRLCTDNVRIVGNIGEAVTSAVSDKNTYMVTEVSSFQLETTSSFRPHISAILNITPDHLNRHKTMQEYCRVKHLIHANQTGSDYFVFNADDPLLKEQCTKESIKAKLVPFGHDADRDYLASFSGTFCELRDGYITICDREKVFRIAKMSELQIPGMHNCENAMAAALMAYCAGADPEKIAEGLRAFKGVEHRIEFVRELCGVKYVNDSKGTNPDSVIKALDALDCPVVLIAGGYDKQISFDGLAARFCGKVKSLVLLGDTALKIKKAACDAGFAPEKISVCADLEECVLKARSDASQGDCVLLSPACASWDMYSGFEERGRHFKDIVRSLK